MNLKKTNSSIPYLMLAVLFFIIYLGYIKLHHHPWYMDDPDQVAILQEIKNPLDIFFDPQVQNNFGNPFSIVPIFMFSLWLDIQLFSNQVHFFYWHNIVSGLLTCFLLYKVLLRFSKHHFFSFTTTLLWLLLPSTISIMQWISARHYMEGFLFFLLMVEFIERYQESKEEKNYLYLITSICCGILAMLSKDIFVTITPVYLFFRGWWIQDRKMLLNSIALSFFYTTYRFFIIGGNIAQEIQLLQLKEVIILHLRFGYALIAHWLGLIIILGSILLTIWYINRKKSASIPIFTFAVIFWLSSFIPVFPVMIGFYYPFKIPGEIYRYVFFLNTIIIVWTNYLIIEYSNKQKNHSYFKLFPSIVLLLLILIGTKSAQEHWQMRKDKLALEIQFYENNVDKLLYIEEHAFYLHGYHRLYWPDKENHFIASPDATSYSLNADLEKYTTIWRYDKKEKAIIEDKKLYSEIIQHN